MGVPEGPGRVLDGMAFRFPRRLPAWVVPALAATSLLLLTSCSKLKLGYEYADWMVLYAVEDNFDLEKVQRNRFKDEVETYFRWHRKTMLPVYADFLSGVSDSLGKGMKPEGLDSGYARYKSLYKQTMEPTVDKAVNLLMGLAPAQVDQWVEKQQKKNAKLRKEFSGSLDERLERRFEKTVDELEDWTGKLSKDQKKQMRTLSRGLPWNGHLWIEFRENVQAKLAGLLKAKAPRAEVRKFIEDYFLYPERVRSEEYNVRMKETEVKTRALILQTIKILTPQQRAHFRTRLDLLAQDFRKMSRQE